MLDIGWSELLVIGVVALIVVGPKDLPGMFRTLGRFTGKARAMAREFSRAMEAAADEAGVKDVAKDLRNVTSPKNLGLDALKDAATKFEAWEPKVPGSTKPTVTAGKGTAGAIEAAATAVAARSGDALLPDPDAPAPAAPDQAKSDRQGEE